MWVGRRCMVLGLAAGPLLLARPGLAQRAKFTLKLGADVPVSHPLTIRAKEAAERIAKDTGGAVDLQVFPNNQLGSDTDMLSQLRSGALEMMSVPGVILATLVPAASLNSVGFAFKDYPTVWRAMDGGVGLYIREQIDKAGLVAMPRIWDNGFRQVTMRPKPVATPEDLHDVKLRVPVSPMLLSMFKSLGASPASINFSELYSALQTRIVEGQENALALISTAKLFEVQKYCSLTRHVWDGYWIGANRKAWNAMPAELSAVVAKHLDQSALDQRGDLEALDRALQAELTAQGMVFNEPDTAPFREQLRKNGFYTEWRGKLGDAAWERLEAERQERWWQRTQPMEFLQEAHAAWAATSAQGRHGKRQG